MDTSSTARQHAPASATREDDQRAIRVVVADNCAFVRVAIIKQLHRHSVVTVVGEAANGNDMLSLVEKTQPDVLVLDIQMPDISISDIARRLQSLPIMPRTLVVTACSDLPVVLSMLSANVTGYLLKDESPTMIAAAVLMIAEGLCCLDSTVAEQLTRCAAQAIACPGTPPERARAQSIQGIPRGVSAETQLSARELDILRLTVRGHTNQEIADALGIAKGTVQNRVSSLYHKIGVCSRTELVAWGWQHGLAPDR